MLGTHAPHSKACEVCHRPFVVQRMGQRVCGMKCARKVPKVAKAKERAQDKERREKLKRVSEWEDECRRIVQKIARIRDRKDGCISCHMGPNYQGQWHGSHYRSVGACSALQFHLWNIHKACAQCNHTKSGNREGYTPRLIAKIGKDRVDWLDAQNQVTKRSGPDYVEYLKRFKRVMGKRARRLELKARSEE